MDTTHCSCLVFHLTVFLPLSAAVVDCLIAEPLAKVDAYAHNQYGNHSLSLKTLVKHFTLDSSVSDLSTHTGF